MKWRKKRIRGKNSRVVGRLKREMRSEKKIFRTISQIYMRYRQVECGMPIYIWYPARIVRKKREVRGTHKEVLE